MDGQFLIYGNDFVTDADAMLAAGQWTLNDGSALFAAGQVVVFDIVDADDAGQFTGLTQITGITVYDSYDDYLGDVALYTYSGSVTIDPAGMGDGLLFQDLSDLTSLDAGAPVLGDSFIAPGRNAAEAIGDLTLDAVQDLDQPGDGAFGLAAADYLYNGPSGQDFVIEGTLGDDEIRLGYSGDPDGDTIDGNDAADGSNDDVVRAGAGNDTVVTGDGDDLIDGGHGNDRLEGDDGADTILGGAGDDSVWGGIGGDSIIGGTGDDSVQAYDGADYVEGGDGDDWMNGDRGDDTLIGGAGNDWMRGSFGNEWMEGGTGDDYIWSGYGDDTIRMENDFGNDTIEMEGQDETLGDLLDFSAVTDDLTFDLTTNYDGGGAVSDGTSTAIFEDVEHLMMGAGNDTVVLADFGGADTVEGFGLPVLNPDGTYSTVDRLDLSQMTDEDGETLGAGDVVITANDAGDVMFVFPKGESLVLAGISPDALSDPDVQAAIGLPTGAAVVDPPDEGGDGGGDGGAGDGEGDGEGDETGLNGVISGTAGDDLIDASYTDDPEGDLIDNGDAILAGAGPDDDSVEAGEGNDTIDGGAGNDFIRGGIGNDSLIGGQGNDTLIAGAGNDTLVGGGGDSWIEGNAGNDEFLIGDGDIAWGGDGDDRFFINRDTLGYDVEMTIDGGAGAEVEGDWLTIEGPATITYDADDPESGTVTWDDGSRLNFSDIEKVIHVPCFTTETLIRTARGDLRAADLQVGDNVLTRDAGYQPIRWIGLRAMSGAELARQPKLRPVRIKAGALALNQPARDLLVSPQHRMLVSGGAVEMWFGEDEVLVPAIQMTCLDGVDQQGADPVTYVHFMFDAHQLVLGDGAWSESFQPGDQSLAGMDQAQRDELFALFPDLAHKSHSYGAVRPTLTGRETRVLFGSA